MRIKINFYAALLLFAFHFQGFSQPVYDNSDERLYLDFFILESSFAEGSFLTGDIEEQGFLLYNGGRLPKNRPNNDRMITLRSAIIFDSSLKNEPIYLAAVFTEYPQQIYLNGHLIGVRGNYKEGYTNRILFNENILLTPALIKYDTVNEIAFQLYPKEGETAPFLEVFIANNKTTDSYVFKRNFFNSIFFQAIAFCSIILFIYFIFLYLSHKTYRQKQFLLFSLINLFFALSYVNQLFTFNFAHTYLLEKIVRCSQPLLIYVSLCFIIEYTNLFQQKNKIYRLLSIPFIIATVFILFQSNTYQVIWAYNLLASPLLFAGAFVMLAFTWMAAFKNRDVKSISLLIVFLFFFVAILHDAYYFSVLHQKPYLLMVPYVFFYINITIFFLMAREQAKIYILSNANEKKLSFLNENLENLVEARTKELNEQSIKLKEANSTKDKFYSIISHDLRNPFHNIIGFSDLLGKRLEEISTSEAQIMVKYINDSAKSTYILLDNLLNWAKSQMHLIPYEPAKHNLRTFIDECIREIEYNAVAKMVTLKSNISAEIFIEADKNMLQLIVRNLLTNAIKYSTQNTIIELNSKVKGKMVEISVIDNGIGMDEAVLEKLFKIGETVTLPGTDNEKGSGLGLLLCKEFVEKHGGTIWAESKKGAGSVFNFTMPIA